MRKRLLIVLLVALAVPQAASAHANLVRTLPANGSVLAEPPAAVRVVFDDKVTAGPGVAAIRNGGGSVQAGAARVAGGRTLVVPLRRGLGEGDYSVRWSILSNDGHVESGVLAFAVGLGRAAPLAGLVARPTGPSAEDVVGRWLLFAGILGAAGIALFTFVARPRDDERVALILSTAAVLAALGAAEGLSRAGIETRNGAAMAVCFALAVLVASGAAAASLDRRALRPALVLAVALVAVPAFGGHALDRGISRINVVADVLHVAGAAAWVGALVGLVAVRGANGRRAAVLAVGGVILLGATGIVRTVYELVRVSQLWDTGHGRMLLVKTALLVTALGAGWLVRSRLQRRAAVELVLVAGLVVAVSVLVGLRPGRSYDRVQQLPVQVSERSPEPPPPPAGAVVLAREVGPFGVAVAVQPARTTVTVFSPAGGGLSGLDVRVQGEPARACGSGCYAAPAAAARSLEVKLGERSVTFELPARPVPADALVRRVHRRFRTLRSVVYDETLASDETHSLHVRWRLESPNRLAARTAGGAAAVVIGTRRWDRDRPSAPWQPSPQTPLPQPAAPWTYAANANVIAQTGRTTTVSFADPTVPAYYTLTIDRRTLLPRVLHMTAAAHFMVERYRAFNLPRAIFPPR